MLPRYGITFDIDWAPDWAVANCAEMCRSRGIPATFFVTHPSPVVDELRRDGSFEIGIHPNFLEGSSHGGGFTEVIESCLGMAPEARAMRAHDLFTCSSLFELVAERFTQIAVDCSLFLPGYPHCLPVDGYFGTSARRIVRIPFSWADNVAARTPGWSWETDLPPAEGLTVLNFHPIHIALNLNDPSRYAGLKSHMGRRPLTKASRSDVTAFEHPGCGARRFLQRLLDRIAPGDCAKMSEIAARHIKSTES